MSDNVKKVGKLTGKTIGFFVFAALFIFNIQLVTSDDITKDINFLGLKFQVGNDVLAARSTDDDDGGGGGGGGESCSESAVCSGYYGNFSISCSASGATAECIGFDYSYVQCRAWYSNGTLKSYSYSFCP